jgi:hypothetical protein
MTPPEVLVDRWVREQVKGKRHTNHRVDRYAFDLLRIQASGVSPAT